MKERKVELVRKGCFNCKYWQRPSGLAEGDFAKAACVRNKVDTLGYNICYGYAKAQ
jgi:hypothetical protein